MQFDSLINSKEGREQLGLLQAKHANMLVQNNLSNSIGPPQSNSAQPMQMNHQQMSMAAQQQLGSLQQQQQEQQYALAQSMQQPMQGFPQGMMSNPNFMNQQVQISQMNPQLLAQYRLQQLAQANLVRQPAQNPNVTSAQILARAQQAQTQLTQVQNAMGMPQQQSMEQSAAFGSPRPTQQPMQAKIGGQRIPPDKVAQMKVTLQKVATMTDAQREACFQSVSLMSSVVSSNIV